MLKCDRCNDNYEYQPTVVQGKRNIYFLCPLCSYDLRKSVDKFANCGQKNWTERTCGHIIAYIKHIRNTKRNG